MREGERGGGDGRREGGKGGKGGYREGGRRGRGMRGGGNERMIERTHERTSVRQIERTCVRPIGRTDKHPNERALLCFPGVLQAFCLPRHPFTGNLQSCLYDGTTNFTGCSSIRDISPEWPSNFSGLPVRTGRPPPSCHIQLFRVARRRKGMVSAKPQRSRAKQLVRLPDRSERSGCPCG
jgi:hypothetical protein